MFQEKYIQIVQQGESNYILDHLEESIIIVSEQSVMKQLTRDLQYQIEFVNDLFLF